MQEIKEMLFNGTSEEFRRIVEAYKLLLYSVVYASSVFADADDIVQETFIYAYYHWGTLREKLNLLSEKKREVMMLYYFAEKSISEIARLLEIPEGTVKYRLFEGRKTLKKELIYMMEEEKKLVEEKNIWENVKAELDRALEARFAYQKGEANAICDKLIEQFKDMDPTTFSKDEIRLMIGVYHQKFLAVEYLEKLDHAIVYEEKCAELAEISDDDYLKMVWYGNYAGELANLGESEKSNEYYAKSLALAEKRNDVPNIADYNYWLGAGHLDLDGGNVDREKMIP